MSVVAALVANVAIWTAVGYFTVRDIGMIVERVDRWLVEHREECDRCRARAIRRQLRGRHVR